MYFWGESEGKGFVVCYYLELSEAAHREVWLHLLGGVQGDAGKVFEVFQVLSIKLGQGMLQSQVYYFWYVNLQLKVNFKKTSSVKFKNVLYCNPLLEKLINFNVV